MTTHLAGGAFYLHAGATATLENVNIEGVTASSPSSLQVRSATISHDLPLSPMPPPRSRVTFSSSLQGGVFYVGSEATATLTNVTIGSTAVTAPTIHGGIFFLSRYDLH